jgi:hypothetical protein|tara:strand:- start:1706 stop:2005 length:300 start_codon:yes stop_codon:yes gene_type:complete
MGGSDIGVVFIKEINEMTKRNIKQLLKETKMFLIDIDKVEMTTLAVSFAIMLVAASIATYLAVAFVFATFDINWMVWRAFMVFWFAAITNETYNAWSKK